MHHRAQLSSGDMAAMRGKMFPIEAVYVAGIHQELLVSSIDAHPLRLICHGESHCLKTIRTSQAITFLVQVLTHMPTWQDGLVRVMRGISVILNVRHY
jgi:hypothetical protein